MTVAENKIQREREYVFLLGYLSAEIHGKTTKSRIQPLRLAVLAFVKSVFLLDASIAQLVAEQLSGQPVLFRDCLVQLKEQLQMTERATEIFNCLACSASSAGIELEDLRKSLQSETDRQISIWISLARALTLGAFGNAQEFHTEMDRCFLLCEPQSRERSERAGE